MTGELGHGGMAVVYRARDTQLLRDVAIKVLHPHLAGDPESRRRFLREAQAAARLRHPNIVEVFDFSGEGDRESFMVTELLEGPTLRRFAEQHPGMPAEVVAAIGIVICDALACAHEQGVIHRDVKPDNILLQRGGLLKLTDFGIAHVADSGAMTVTGQVLGSPAHMAPEQIEGRAIDARADLFAMGTVLYALGVGRLPFEAPHPHALLRKILESEYPDPLRAAPTIGHRFAGIIRRCLEREPSERYANAGELRRALGDFVREAGWDSADAQLKKYLEDPEGFAAAHRAKLLERLPELGAQARRAGNLPDALGYFNRALALDPTNERVLALVTGISRRRKIRKALGAAAIVGVAAALSATGVVAIARKVRGGHRAQPVAIAAGPLPPVVTPESGRGGAAGPEVPPVPHEGPQAPRERVAPPEENAVVNPSHPGEQRASASGPNVARTSPRSGQPVGAQHTGSSSGSGNSAAEAAPRGTRMVRLVVSPQGVFVGIDGAEPRDLAGRSLELSVGEHRFRIVPTDHSCNDQTWPRVVEAGEGEQRIPLHLDCQPTSMPAPTDARRAVAAP